MKTGKLFAGVALATLTAACTNEVMQLEPQAPEAGNRPMVNVELSFDEDAVEMGSGETRLEFDKVTGQGYQWLFAEGDRVGGLLMDTWNGGDCGNINDFTLVDYVHTNYAFIRKTGADGKAKWVTPENAPVCEGNYFFYFPYNDKFAHRGYVGWSVNPVQKQYTEAGELFQMQSVKENQKWIGYKFVSDELEGKVNKIDFDFVPVFAMPTFDFVNMTGAQLKVNKLVVRCTSNPDYPAINPYGTHDLMATTMALTPATRGFRGVNAGWEKLSHAQKTAEMWKKAQSYTYNSTKDEQYVWPVNSKNASLKYDIKNKAMFALNQKDSTSIFQEPTYDYVADFSGVKGGYWVGAMEHVQAILTMPSGLYAYGDAQTFEAYLYVTSTAGDDYVVRIDLGNAQTQGATNTSEYDDIVSGAANKFLKAGMYTKYKASFDAGALQSYAITDFKVTSTEDLLWVLNEAEGDGIYDLAIGTSGKRVVLDERVEKLLNEKPYIRLHINGEITIGKGASENAINLLYFDNDAWKTTLNIENKQVKKPEVLVDVTTGNTLERKVIENCVINVKKGGELDTKTNQIGINAPVTVADGGTVKAWDIVGNVENRGTVEARDIVGNVTNYGTLNARNISGDIKNYDSLTAGDVTKCIAASANGDVINYAGTLKVGDVKNGKVVNYGGANASVASVEGTVDNAGTIELRGKEYMDVVTNNGTMNITGWKNPTTNRYETCLKKALNNNNGTLNANCEVTGESTATNSATINISEGQFFKFEAITNNGLSTINVAENAKLITLSNDDDKIVNAGIINNDGNAHKIKNNGKIVAGAKSYTVITSGVGTVDNSKLGDVSYEYAPEQTVILKVADITGISVAKLNDMIQKADANQLIITEGTLDLGDKWSEIKGHDVDNHLSHFAKGIILEKNVTIIGEPGCDVTFYTNEITIQKASTLFADTYAKVAFCGKNGSSSVSTTMHVNGLLKTADHATVKGYSYLKLLIDGNGEVHNSAVIEGTLDTTWSGTWTGNAIK